MIEKLGTDHRVSIEEREQKILDLMPLRRGSYIYLQTCNRVELYRGDGTAEEQLVRYLFRVVSGLESKMIGEAHIQGQVKRAYMEAREYDHINSGLHRLFQIALRCGKRVRSETAISTGAVSHAHAAVLALRNWSLDPNSEKVLVIGVNDLTRRIVMMLKHHENLDITVMNRTVEHIAIDNRVTPVSLDLLSDSINKYSVIISGTSSGEIIVSSKILEPSQERLMIDLAVPRDIDPLVAEMPDTELLTVEELESLVHQSIDKRQGEITAAEAIVEEEITHYYTAIEKGERYAQTH